MSALRSRVARAEARYRTRRRLRRARRIPVRSAAVDDIDAIDQLWQRVGLRSTIPIGREHVLAACTREPHLVLVAGSSGTLDGAVLGTFDGLRGWMYGLAVEDSARRRGVATALVTVLEQRFRRLDVWIAGGLVRREDAIAFATGHALGYTEVAPRAVYHGNPLVDRPMPEVEGLRVRRAGPHDLDAVLELWETTGISSGDGALEREATDLLRHDPALFLVAEIDDRVVGATMGAFDGVQGWGLRLAVDPRARRQRVAGALNIALGHELMARGATWIGGLVLEQNPLGSGYAHGTGSRTWSDWAYLRKRLAPPAPPLGGSAMDLRR